tara:strand:+ start:219 stop:1286 length:1068 start_codon:yes stop_codon:yes gene_type:complete
MADVNETESSTVVKEKDSDVSRESSTAEDQDVKVEDSSTEETMADAIKTALEEEGAEFEETETPETESEEPDKAEAKQEEPVESEKDAGIEEKPEAEDSEPDLHEMPEGLKPKAEERFQSLVNDNKAKAEYIDQANEALSGMQEAVKQTGLNAEGFGTLMDFARLANSNNTEDRKEAFKLIKNEYHRQAQFLGEKVEGVDHLADFPELKNRVEDFELSEDDALKIAQAERLMAQHKEQSQQTSLEAERARQSDAEKQTALDEVGVFMNSMKKADIDFEAKNSKLMSMVDDIRRDYPANQWPSVVKHLYGAMGSASNQRIENKKATANPVVSSNVSTGDQVPKTMLEAINQALDVQ